MERRTALLLALSVALSALLLVYFGDFGRVGATTARSSPSTSPGATPSPAEPTLAGHIASILAKLRRNAATAGDLTALRRALFADPAAGIAAILGYLVSGEDAATGQTLTVGASGTLSGAPTLRIFLLDILGQLTRITGGTEAAVVARRILDGKDSPDEWAIALRNVAWGEPKSRGYLAAKTHDLLAYEPWTASPTAGMLEAFDVAVYSGDPTFIPQLANLARNGNSAVQRAATLALDRLAQTSPLAVMNFLNANPDEIADRPFVRADYFAKANLADNAQREAVEHYLTRQDVGVPEKTKFLHALASPGSFVGDSLLSTAAKPTDDDARYDAIAMATTGWLKSRLAPEVSGEIAWLFTRVTADP